MLTNVFHRAATEPVNGGTHFHKGQTRTAFPFRCYKIILFSFLRMRQKITRYGAYFTKWHFKGMPGIFGGHDRNGGRGTALRFTDIRRGVAK